MNEYLTLEELQEIENNKLDEELDKLITEEFDPKSISEHYLKHFNNFKYVNVFNDANKINWFYYDIFNILVNEIENPRTLKEYLTEKYGEITKQNTQIIILEKKKTQEDKETNKYLMNKIKKYEEASKELGKPNTINNVITQLELKVNIKNGYYTIDNILKLLAFNDGFLFDVKLKDYRPIEKADYISKVCKVGAPQTPSQEKINEAWNIIYSMFENEELTRFHFYIWLWFIR